MLSFLTKDYRFAALMAALVLYALIGSPTPDHPSWGEVVIGLLLVAAIGVGSFFSAFSLSLQAQQEYWQIGGRVFLLYGLLVPLGQGVFADYPADDIARDIVGLVFLCLPIFLYDFLKNDEQKKKFFLWACLGIGLLFSLRVLFANEVFSGDKTGLLYLANSPLVLFTALFLAASSGKKLFYDVDIKHIALVAVFLAGAIIALLAMFVDLQRASFAAMALTIISLFVIGFIKAPLRTVFPFIVTAGVLLIFSSYITDIAEHVALKTARVGMNMRWQEAQAVWEAVSVSGFHVLFGYGWGGSFDSPAVGGLPVTYTHSLLTYLFFKVGLVGLSFALIYLFFIFEKLARVYFSDPVKGNALMWPLMIPVLLYASHKSLDFGLLLTLAVVTAAAVGKAQKQTRAQKVSG